MPNKRILSGFSYKKTAEGIAAARTKTSSMWNSATASVSASTGKMLDFAIVIKL